MRGCCLWFSHWLRSGYCRWRGERRSRSRKRRSRMRRRRGSGIRRRRRRGRGIRGSLVGSRVIRFVISRSQHNDFLVGRIGIARRSRWKCGSRIRRRRQKGSTFWHFNPHSQFSRCNIFQLEPNVVRFARFHLVQSYFTTSELSFLHQRKFHKEEGSKERTNSLLEMVSLSNTSITRHWSPLLGFTSNSKVSFQTLKFMGSVNNLLWILEFYGFRAFFTTEVVADCEVPVMLTLQKGSLFSFHSFRSDHSSLKPQNESTS